MGNGTKDCLAVTLTSAKLARLQEARALFESDTKNKIEMDDFIDMLVKTFLAYRNQRGASESDLLTKLTKE